MFGRRHRTEVHLVADHQIRMPAVDDNADQVESSRREHTGEVGADHRVLVVEVGRSECARGPTGRRCRVPLGEVRVEAFGACEDVRLPAHAETVAGPAQDVGDREHRCEMAEAACEREQDATHGPVSCTAGRRSDSVRHGRITPLRARVRESPTGCGPEW